MRRTIQIPADFLETLTSKKLNATEIQAALALVKLTWARGLDKTQVTLGRLADMLSSSRTTVSHALKHLADYNLLIVEHRPGDHRGNFYTLVPDPRKWAPPAKMPELRIRIFRRDDYTCQYCGRVDRRARDLSLDHVIPQFLGGQTASENLVTSCGVCNVEKSSVGLGEFIERRPGARARIGPLLDRARVLGLTAADFMPRARRRPKSRLGASLEIEIETGELPSPAEIAARAGRFVCPIFNEECPRVRARGGVT